MPGTHDRALFRIARAAADALGRPIEDLPPLGEAVDLEGLEALLEDPDSENVTVTFTYAGLQVVVRGESVVFVRPTREGVDDHAVQWR